MEQMDLQEKVRRQYEKTGKPICRAGEIREEKVRKYFGLSLSEIERRTRKMLKKTLNRRLARAAEGKPIMMYHYGIYTKLADMEIFLTKEEIQTLLSKDRTHALEYNRVLIKKYL